MKKSLFALALFSSLAVSAFASIPTIVITQDNGQNAVVSSAGNDLTQTPNYGSSQCIYIWEKNSNGGNGTYMGVSCTSNSSGVTSAIPISGLDTTGATDYAFIPANGVTTNCQSGGGHTKWTCITAGSGGGVFYMYGHIELVTPPTPPTYTSQVTSTVGTSIGNLGVGILAILGLIIGFGVAYIVFKIGWRKIRGAIR